MAKENEFYPTPEDLAAYLFKRFLWQVPSQIFAQTDENGDDVIVQILEPSAGTGAFAKAMAHHGQVTAIDPNFDDPQIEGVEWARMSLEELGEACDGERPFDLACGNPPFSLAEAHLRILFKIVRHHGYVGFLLRLGFLSSGKRAPFFRVYPPKHIYVLPKRPSFVWSWTCKPERGIALGGLDDPDDAPIVKGCGHKWMDEPGIEHRNCPQCGATGNLQCVKTDQYDYMFAIWKVGAEPLQKTEITWLNNEGEEDENNVQQEA